MDRRKFLKIAGSAGVIVAAGSTGFVVTRTPHQALRPWKMAAVSDYAEPIHRALSWAILAPNPHNRQPWLVDIINHSEAMLYCDRDRLLPETDPYDRQIVIGLGCFLELFTLAANADGQDAQIQLFPEGEPAERLDARPIARLRLTQDSAQLPDPLFEFAEDKAPPEPGFVLTGDETVLVTVNGAAISRYDLEEAAVRMLGKAQVLREGDDLTIVSWSATVHECMAAAQALGALGVEAEIIDLRSLWPWDKSTVFGSVRRTGRLLVAHEAVAVGGFGAEVVATVAEHCHDALKAAVRRLGAPRSPIAYAPNLEDAVRVTRAMIEAAGVGLLSDQAPRG